MPVSNENIKADLRSSILEAADQLDIQNQFRRGYIDHLIRSLLTVDLKDRITWKQYFEHPFLEKGDFWKFYTDKKSLGTDLYFEVFSVKKRDGNEKRAIKVMYLNTLKKKIENAIKRPCTTRDIKPYINDFIEETKNMDLLRGPNKDNINALIFYEYFQTETEFCIVQELCDGNIQHLLLEKKKFNKKEIYQVLKQLNNTFHILLDKNLSHKNLRLDKILVKKNDKDDKEVPYIYKLTGLEFNRKIDALFKRGGAMTNDKYKAPEILINEFSGNNISPNEKNLIYQKADIWSLGVIIFILYFGKFPFKGNKPIEIYTNISKSEKASLNEINDPDLKDLLKKMLTEDNKERIDWNGYFKHKFFSPEKWE